MKKIFILIPVFIFSSLTFAQTDWAKWEGHKISYALPELANTETTNTKANDFVSVSQQLYKKLFSNLDGDNCAFHPSCSTFFVQAVHKTNFIIGTLLFIDRFTRDLNYAKGYNNYPLYKDGHFYDPVKKYIK